MARKYEKDRRIPFNALLDRLAAILPNNPSPGGGGAGDPDSKWTKAQVVENAIRHIKSARAAAPVAVTGDGSIAGDSATTSGASQQKLKLLVRQNRRLRELLRTEV